MYRVGVYCFLNDSEIMQDFLILTRLAQTHGIMPPIGFVHLLCGSKRGFSTRQGLAAC
jgi:hypothetical protein